MEVWSGKPAIDYDSLHVFGSTAYYHVKESKLDPREKKALFMGITSGVKGFRLWCLDTKKMIGSRDVTFDESATLKKVEFEQVRICPVNKSNSPATMEELEVEEVLTQEPLTYALPVVDDDIPVTYQEAMQSLESDKWKSAMDEEMQSLRKNNTWELAQLPKGKRAIGCKWLNFELAQLDVKTTFLHGELEEEIYMTQPEGYEDAGGRNWVCKLNKSLYGLKQSPRQWYKSFIYLLLYVDDMLIASKSQKEIDKLKAQLNQEFKMKDLGEAKKILGMEISRDRQRGKLCLNQKQYLKKTEEEREYMEKVPYANAVGSLMYAMILRYLQKTVDVGLVFEQDEALGQFVVGYVDSDFAGDLDKRRSTTGYLFTLAKAPVSWKSTLQSTVAISTTEAEYTAVTEAVKEAIWLNGLLEDLGVVQSHISLYFAVRPLFI
ncbi:hypothetical protein CXB51_002217 [Gossypium anomalum]|uniref:Reverse transcriptase Ty1/copia-type domain-containing protein n=1 Tax=Gossypium anomalum TaxID=47600 RepID=A0A8J5Z8X3_9ROSI|nr:hypothetical protein CXB51_002217 [Gossypium anomalum]